MIKVDATLTAEHSRLVKLEAKTGSIDGNRDGLVFHRMLQFRGDGGSHPCALGHLESLHLLLVLAFFLVFPFVGVLFLSGDSVVCHVPHGIRHVPTVAPFVLVLPSCAINQLLRREASGCGVPLQSIQTLHGTAGRECPARPTLTLVFD